MTFQVSSPGLLTTLQARSRMGWQHLGISPCGPMDARSHWAANQALANPEDAATLEFTLLGPRLEVQADTWIALAGADFGVTLDGQVLSLGKPVRVLAGSTLVSGSPRQGCRGYLAVAGGFQVQSQLGSRATDLKGRFGGLGGRPLRAGDVLPFAPGAPCPGAEMEIGQAIPDLAAPARLRLVPGPHLAALDPASADALFDTAFTMNPRSDRQGIRLLGDPLTLSAAVEVVTEGVSFGTLQLPPDGLPILLMADRQPTGGYPRLGEVYSADLPRAAQLRPGEELRFILGNLDEARRLAGSLEWSS